MNKKLIMIGIILGMVIPVAAYTGAPLFFDVTTDEPLPEITKKQIDPVALGLVEAPKGGA